MAPWADVLYACDKKWWRVKRPPPGQLAPRYWVTQDKGAAAEYGLHWVQSRTGLGLCREPWVVNQGLNSGHQALNLAYHLGATRILLLGYDMQRTEGRSHWFGDHPRGLQIQSPYDQFAERLALLAVGMAAAGIRVVNCSAQTALTCFERRTIYEELEL